MKALFDNQYELLHEIGHGAYGRVWLARDFYKGKEVAIKIYTPCCEYDIIKRIIRQAEVFASIHHSNLLPILKIGFGEGSLYIVMPYCPLGTIEKMRGEVTETVLWKMISDIANGLNYLDGHGFVHLDIKPANILLDKAGNYVISDYGIDHLASCNLAIARDSMQKYGGYAYRAPECFYSQQKIGSKSDIWSLGATLFELITGELYMLRDKKLNSFDYSQRLCKTIQLCLSDNPEKRPSASELVKLSERMLSQSLWNRLVRHCEIIGTKIFIRRKACKDVKNQSSVRTYETHEKYIIGLMLKCRIVKGENGLYGVMIDNNLMLGFEYDEIREFRECAWPGPGPCHGPFFIGAFFRQKDDVGYFIIRKSGIINEYRRCTIEMFRHLCALT